MPFSETQKKEVLEVLDAVNSYSAGRRVLSTIFRELPDKNEWKEYYAVIPQPRCLDGVKASIEKNRLPSVDAVKADIELIFRNAMHFNQDGSTIWEDARTLLEVFEKTWATMPSLRKNTLIIKRTPKAVPVPPPPSEPVSASPPHEVPSTSKPVDVNKAMSATKRGTGETTMRQAPEVAEVENVATAAAVANRPPAISFQPVRASYQPPRRVQYHKRKIDDRSVSAAAGGPAYVRDAKIEVLPSETVEKFDRDPQTGKLLWFSGPPIRPTPPSLYHPRHSLAYLAFLARTQKEETTTPIKQGLDDLDGNTKRRRVEGEGMEIDNSGGTVEKLPLSSMRQLLDQWHVEQDGSLKQHTAPSALESETLTPQSEFLATSINNLALSLLWTEDTRK